MCFAVGGFVLVVRVGYTRARGRARPRAAARRSAGPLCLSRTSALAASPLPRAAPAVMLGVPVHAKGSVVATCAVGSRSCMQLCLHYPLALQGDPHAHLQAEPGLEILKLFPQLACASGVAPGCWPAAAALLAARRMASSRAMVVSRLARRARRTRRLLRRAGRLARFATRTPPAPPQSRQGCGNRGKSHQRAALSLVHSRAGGAKLGSYLLTYLLTYLLVSRAA